VRAPERIARLVLCAPAGVLPVAAPEVLLGPAGVVWDAAVRVRRHLEPLAAWPIGRRVLLGTSTAPGDALTADGVRAIIRGTAGARSTAAALRTVALADLRGELAALPRPVGFLWGEHDRVIPRRALEAGVVVRPDAAVAIVEGAGHLPMLERPDAFVAALQGLLER
jgi:pimeloyl-ACP methyl ester carboxylesterase